MVGPKSFHVSLSFRFGFHLGSSTSFVFLLVVLLRVKEVVLVMTFRQKYRRSFCSNKRFLIFDIFDAISRYVGRFVYGMLYIDPDIDTAPLGASSDDPK